MTTPLKAIQYDGKNDREVCSFVTGRKLGPFELADGFWQRQRGEEPPFEFTLAMPARCGEVYLHPGDWAVREPHGWIRLSDAQFRAEYPPEPPQ